MPPAFATPGGSTRRWPGRSILQPDGEPDAAELAASYAFGIARNHPFVDGNQRTAFVVLELFLALNGFGLEADDAACVLMMLALAAGELDEPTLAAWIRARLTRR